MVWRQKQPAIHSNTSNSCKLGKCHIIFFTIISCIDWMWWSIFLCWTRKKKNMEYMEAVWQINRCTRPHLCLPFTRTRKYNFAYSWEICRLVSRSSKHMHKHKWRKDRSILQKRRLLEEFPLTLDAFKLHVNRAVYQTSYCLVQLLLKDPVLPWSEWMGLEYICDEGYNLVWNTPKASKMCQEMIRCGCNSVKGCKAQGRCKCIKASLKCTALCRCGGCCEH